MRPARLAAPLALVLLAAGCGGEEEPPPARYDVFTLSLGGLAEGERVVPGQELVYHVDYQGDLARNLTLTARFTHEESGESASTSWSESPQESRRFTFGSRWRMRHEFLKRPGRIRVQLEASVTATLRGSTPWVARSQSVLVDLQPRLDALTLAPSTPGVALPYGTPLRLAVAGRDLHDDVTLLVVDAATGEALAGLERTLAFDGTQTSLSLIWTLNAPVLERVGTHALHLVARYGVLEARSEPLALEVTHTVDTVTVLLRDATGRLTQAPGVAPARLDRVAEVVLRIEGTQLAGRPLRVDGGAAVVAPADTVEVPVATPDTDDFESGVGLHRYDFVVRSGGMEREAHVTLQRWGIESCGWRAGDGRPSGRGETFESGAGLVLHARLWGFPDTTTRLFLFRSPVAHFTLWERDSGRDPLDLLANHDDEVETLDADVRSGEAQAPWTAHHDEESSLFAGRAEYYFEVEVEDQRCASDLVQVHPPSPSSPP